MASTKREITATKSCAASWESDPFVIGAWEVITIEMIAASGTRKGVIAPQVLAHGAGTWREYPWDRTRGGLYVTNVLIPAGSDFSEVWRFGGMKGLHSVKLVYTDLLAGAGSGNLALVIRGSIDTAD